MRNRYLGAAIVALTLIAGACGSTDSELLTRGQALSYALSPGSDLTYAMDMTMDMTMEMDGMDGLDLDGPIEMGMDMEGITKFSIEDGEAAGTYDVTMSVSGLEFTRLSMKGAGQDMDFDDPATINSMLANDDVLGDEVRYTIDEKGNVLSLRAGGVEIDPSALFGGDMLSGMNNGMSQLFGPALPDGDIAVGDTWSNEYEVPLPGEGVMARATNKIVGEETINGTPVLVIETKTTMDPISMNLADMMALADDVAGSDDPFGAAGMDEFLGSLEMSMTMTIGEATTKVWFDPVSGTSLRQEFQGSVDMDIEMSGMPGMDATTMVMQMVMDGELVLLR